jgi:hypothetical protein
MPQMRLRIVKYHGSTQNPESYAREVQRIFARCGINVSWTIRIANRTETIHDLREDLDLCYGVWTGDPERVKTRAGVPRPTRGQVPVAFVRAIKKFTWSLTYNPEPTGSMSVVGFTDEGLCSVNNRARQPHVLAHEVGHFFLGPGHVGDQDNLMWQDPNNSTRSTGLTAEQCRRITSQLPG